MHRCRAQVWRSSNVRGSKESCANFAKLMPARKICNSLYHSRARRVWLSVPPYFYFRRVVRTSHNSCAQVKSAIPFFKYLPATYISRMNSSLSRKLKLVSYAPLDSGQSNTSCNHFKWAGILYSPTYLVPAGNLTPT
jgi:hypothetical protein